jgi:hypothetical protein
VRSHFLDRLTLAQVEQLREISEALIGSAGQQDEGGSTF